MNPDFKDLLCAFNAEKVEFIVVGAHALAAHGHVRATKDLDIWVRPNPDNAVRVIQALKKFGAPLLDLSEKDLSRPGVVFQIGVAPLRIDILTEITGVDFDAAWTDRLLTFFGEESVAVLSRHHLIQNKRASGLLQDLADLENLEKSSSE